MGQLFGKQFAGGSLELVDQHAILLKDAYVNWLVNAFALLLADVVLG